MLYKPCSASILSEISPIHLLLTWVLLELMMSSAVMAQQPPSSASPTQQSAPPSVLIPDRSSQFDLNTQIQAIPEQRRSLITGGTDSRDGRQRFHSFQEFNIAPGHGVYFQASPQLETILSRVTGSSPSEIFGTLGIMGGNADLFLLNPNGIYFGSGAKLDLRGSFFASTADTVTWPSSNADSPGDSSSSPLTTLPLLSLGIPPGLQLGQLQGEVRNQAELSVAPGQSITLLGKAVEHRGGLVAPGGAVRLLGDRVLLLDQAQVDVSATNGGGQVWIGGDRQGQGQLPLASQTGIAPEVQIRADAITQGLGGEVIVWADGQTQFYGQISAQGGPQGGDGGFVEVSGRETLRFEGTVNTEAPLGTVGTLLLDPTNIEVVPFFTFTNRFDVDEFSDPDQQNQTTQISASTIENAASNIVLQATDTITFNTNAVEIRRPGVGLTAQAGGQILVNGSITTGAGGDLRLIAGDRGNGVVPGQGDILVTSALEPSFLRADGGDLVLQAGNTIEMNRAQASTFAFRSNNGGAESGQLSIEAQTLRMDDSVLVSSAPWSQQVGGVEIRVQNQVNLSGASQILAQTSQQGNAGAIDITAEGVQLDGSQLSVGSLAEQQGGDAGLIRLRVSETATLENSTIDADALSGNSGSVDFEGGNLVLTQGSLLSNLALGEGTAGNLAIAADSLLLDQSQILSLTLRAASDRDSGQIDVITTGDITLQNGAAIASSTVGQGNSGRLVIISGGAIQLSNQSLFSSAGAGGDLLLQGRSLTLLDGSSIQTTAFDPKDFSLSALGLDGLELPSATQVLEDLQRSPFNGQTAQSGQLSVEIAGDIFVAGTSGITTAALSEASGGDLKLEAQNLTMRPISVISSQAERGLAGNLTLQLGGNLDAEAGAISASSLQGGGGKIQIQANEVLLKNRSLLSSSVFDGSAQGGQIDVQANTFVAIEDSDILANAESGSGGLVQINSETFLRGLFDQGRATAVGRNPGSFAAFRGNGQVDISADSFAGEPGTVTFPQVEPERRTSSLPVQLPDQSDRIDRSCKPNSDASRSSFVNTGRGGIPMSPDDLPVSKISFRDLWVPLSEASEVSNQSAQLQQQAIAPQSASPTANRVLEASAWRVLPTGNVQLMAGASLGKTYPGCLASSLASLESQKSR